MWTKSILVVESIACTLLIGHVARAQSVEDIPALRGEFTLVQGTFFGYVPPSVGDSTYFDCAMLDSLANITSFGPGGPGFIPMLDGLEIQRYDTGTDRRAWRLKSGGKHGHLTIDLELHGDSPNRTGTVWIIGKDPYISSVAKIAVEEIAQPEGIDFGSIALGAGVHWAGGDDSASLAEIEAMAERFESEANAMSVVGRALSPGERDRIGKLTEAARYLRKALAALRQRRMIRTPAPSE